MNSHDSRVEASPGQQQKSRPLQGVSMSRPPKRWSRRRSSRVYLVPYAPTLSPIFEESVQLGSSCSPSSQPLLKPSSRALSYGVITPRLNRVVIAVEGDDCGGQLLSSWPERVAKILTLSWLVFSLGVIVLLGGIFMIWMAFVERDGERGGVAHHNVVTAFVGIVVVVMAVLFVLWKALRGLFSVSM